MNNADFTAVNDELERLDCLLKASENWSSEYAKDPITHAKLIRAEAAYEKKVRAWLKDTADRADEMVDWGAYNQIKGDVQVDIVVNDVPLDQANDAFITVSLESITAGLTIGAQAGEVIYDIPLNIQSTDAIMQQLSAERVGFLVGKTVDKNTGKLIDNPKAAYRITDKMRTDITESVKTGLRLGEDRAAVADRITKTIRNPKRATVIAQTEMVNAYGNGLIEFGRQSGATGKQSNTVGAIDYCLEYAQLGVVELGYKYGGKYLCPAYHTGCRCGIRLEYPS